jgi:hypothetical protein
MKEHTYLIKLYEESVKMKEYVWLIKYHYDEELSSAFTIDGVYKTANDAIESLKPRLEYMCLKGYWLMYQTEVKFFNYAENDFGPFHIIRLEVL